MKESDRHNNHSSMSTIRAESMCSSVNQCLPDELIASQALCIDNLQQQIYLLENEISCLRMHDNRLQPSVFLEAEKMVKKLSEAHKEVQNLKADMKRKQANLDLLKSEKDRISRKFEENEGSFYSQKSAYMEEIVTLTKDRNENADRCLELERILQEKVQQENHLQGECDGLRVQVEELQKESAEMRKAMDGQQESRRLLEKSVLELKMRLEVKSISDRDESMKIMRADIEKLTGQLSLASQSAHHEKLLRDRLSEDNENLIKRHASADAELAEVRAKLREEQSLRSSLEDVHLKTAVECSDVRSQIDSWIGQVEDLKHQLQDHKERNLQLATQVADEQRMKQREEQRASHSERRLEQKEEKIKARERENVALLRDNAALKNEVAALKEQLKARDDEVEQLKRKVQEMHASVEEFIQSSKAATRLEGQRWKQLTQLAHGIQTLSEEAVLQKDNL